MFGSFILNFSVGPLNKNKTAIEADENFIINKTQVKIKSTHQLINKYGWTNQ